MAYVNNEDELKQGGAGGQVLAGSGGAAGAAKGPQAVGTGFTNLQTYLSANKGQGGGVADAIVGQGQQAVDDKMQTANTQADTWADGAITKVNNSVDDSVGEIQKYGDWSIKYGGPQTAQDIDGYNDIEQAYQNVKDTATNFQGDRMTQQAGLQKKFGYGSGFAALDGLLGRQDGGDKISSWAQGVNPTPQTTVDKVNTAIADGKKTVGDAATYAGIPIKSAPPPPASGQTQPSPVNLPTIPNMAQPIPPQAVPVPPKTKGYGGSASTRNKVR